MEINKLFKIISTITLSGIMFIGCGDEKVTFKGLEYKVITSPITGKKWLDRNLGASQACTSSTDRACYGDYYQWGRLADGHEKTSSNITTTLANDISDIGNRFVVGYKDWTSADTKGDIRKVQWSKIDGTGICPVGFRVPTQIELKAETDEIFLKLPLSGTRDIYGSIFALDIAGDLWTNSVNGLYSQSKFRSYTESASANPLINSLMDLLYGYRAYGIPVRCIKD